MKKRNCEEDGICIALMQWFELKHRKYTGLLWHVPNGGKRGIIEATKLMRMGVRPGVSDYFLMVPKKSPEFAGLFLEVKASKGRLSPVQKQFLQDAANQGYKAVTAFGLDECMEAIDVYLQGA